MALGKSAALLITFGLLLLSAPRIIADEDAEENIADDLKQQISALSQQIKEAEAGKAEAERLLNVGKEKQAAFSAQLASLKASISAKEEQGDKLQEQLTLLQEEAGKLRGGEKLHKELKDKFQAAGDELEATKDTLSKTLKLLAEKTSQASEAETQVAAAEKKLEAALKEKEAAVSRVAHLESSVEDASTLQKQLEEERSRSSKLEGSLQTLNSETEKLKAELASLRKEVKEVAKESKGWKARAEKAEQAVQSAEHRLEKAMQEHSITKQAKLQAELKAEEAVKKLEAILTAWLPHWLEQYYEQVLHSVQPAVDRVQPTLATAWKHGKHYSQQGHSHALKAYDATKARTLAAWESAQPTLQTLATQSKKQASTAVARAGKAAAPLLAGVKQSSARAYQSAAARSQELLANPRVDKAWRQAQQLWRRAKHSFGQLERLAIRYLKKVPGLQQYAKRPFVTYLVASVLAAPFLTILVPLLALSGKKERASQHDGSRHPQRGAPAEPKSKAKKARVITVGGEQVRVP